MCSLILGHTELDSSNLTRLNSPFELFLASINMNMRSSLSSVIALSQFLSVHGNKDNGFTNLSAKHLAGTVWPFHGCLLS